MRLKKEDYWKAECQACGWQWEARVDHPKACPRCKSYTWDRKEKKDNAKS